MIVLCFYVVRSLEKEDILENSYVLSCFVQLKSVLFNLLCVSDLFSKNAGSQLCFRYICKFNDFAVVVVVVIVKCITADTYQCKLLTLTKRRDLLPSRHCHKKVWGRERLLEDMKYVAQYTAPPPPKKKKKKKKERKIQSG